MRLFRVRYGETDQTDRQQCTRNINIHSRKWHKSQNHRLRGSGSTVVTMTSKVNGITEILTPCRSETPENIQAKLGVIDYVVDPYNLANFCGNRIKGVCSPYW